MALHVLCAKKTKSVVKMRSKNTFLKTLILYFFAQSTGNVIWFWKFAQMWKTYICLSPKNFRFFNIALLFFFKSTRSMWARLPMCHALWISAQQCLYKNIKWYSSCHELNWKFLWYFLKHQRNFQLSCMFLRMTNLN